MERIYEKEQEQGHFTWDFSSSGSKTDNRINSCVIAYIYKI